MREVLFTVEKKRYQRRGSPREEKQNKLTNKNQGKKGKRATTALKFKTKTQIVTSLTKEKKKKQNSDRERIPLKS